MMPHVVFVTAYDEYALKAFEEKTLDYLLKPVEKARLEKTFAKLQGGFSSTRRRNRLTKFRRLRHIPCHSGNRISLIPPAEVEAVRSDLSGVHLLLRRGECFTELTLKVLAERTPLLRCHRQYLVNPDRIETIQLLDQGLAEIRTKAAIPPAGQPPLPEEPQDPPRFLTPAGQPPHGRRLAALWRR